MSSAEGVAGWPEGNKLTEQDVQDRGDFEYLLSIMDKQGTVGITQPSDYREAFEYKSRLESFLKSEMPKGSVAVLFDDVIFDFDGVLYDSTYAAYKTVELVLQKEADKNIPVPATVEEIANSYQAPFKDFYKRFGISLETPEEIASFLHTYREMYTQVNAEHHTPAALYPEVANVLNTMKEAKKDNSNLKVHIISAGHEKHIRDVLVKHDIVGDFDQIHSECHDKTAMIRSIADAARIRERTVMVGDLPSDIKDAQQVEGVRTIAVARGEREKERLGMYLPDYVIGDLNGILDLKSYREELRGKLAQP